jgi:hypothetical protein
MRRNNKFYNYRTNLTLGVQSDYKEKQRAHGKNLEHKKCNSRKYSTFLWLMAILYVARIMIPTCGHIVLMMRHCHRWNACNKMDIK